MTYKNQKKIDELHTHLKANFKSKEFGLREGYIYAGFTKKIQFELFLDYERISLKYPYPNISNEKLDSLNHIISELDKAFVYRTYNTTPKNKYSIWDLNIQDLSYSQIGDLIISFEAYIK